jgi:hypothetical protein
MNPILLSVLLLLGEAAAAPPAEIRLTISRDPYSSSDQVTICRVRADNLGRRTWSGRALRFEARAIDGDRTVRQRGRFGLELGPGGSLETLVILPGRHDRLEVVLLSAAKSSADHEQTARRKGSGRKRRRPAGS